MINIAELKKFTGEDSQGVDQILLPITDFYNFLYERMNFKSDDEAQKFLEKYMFDSEQELIKEFEKRKEVDAVDFADIATIPLKKLCDEIEYDKKDIFIERYKYIIASIQNFDLSQPTD